MSEPLHFQLYGLKNKGEIDFFVKLERAMKTFPNPGAVLAKLIVYDVSLALDRASREDYQQSRKIL